MPKQSRSQTIGREGEKWFEAQLPTSWIPQRPTEDVGVDALVVICENSSLNGLEFRVQIKSSMNWRIRNDSIRLKFPRRSLLDIIKGFTPALLVTYEASSKRGYCFWLNQLVADDVFLLSSHRESVTLSVPMTREVTSEIWPRIGQEVRGLSSAVGNRVSAAIRSFPILEFVHAASQALQTFDFVSHHWANGEEKSKEQTEVLHALEVSSHRDVVRAIKELQHSLPREINPIVGVDDFAQEWISSCESIIPGFGSLIPDGHPDLSKSLRGLKVDHDRMSEKRTGFVRSILEAQVRLTRLGLGYRGDNRARLIGDWAIEINGIGDEVKGVPSSVARWIRRAGVPVPLLEATHSLMRSLHLIDLCTNGKVGSVPLNDLVQAEITAHKEIVLTLQAVARQLTDDGDSTIGLDDVAERYQDACSEFMPRFTDYVKHVGPGFQIQVSVSDMIQHRDELIRKVTQVVERLACLSLEIGKACEPRNR